MRVGGGAPNTFVKQMLTARVALKNNSNANSKKASDKDGGDSGSASEAKKSAQSGQTAQTGGASQQYPVNMLPIPNVAQTKAREERGGNNGSGGNGDKGGGKSQQTNSYQKSGGQQAQQSSPADRGSYIDISA